MAKTDQHPLVLIRWTDSRSAPFEWDFAADLSPLTPSTCQTVGFLLHDGKDYKTLAMSLSQTQVLGRLSIPTRAILSIRKLRQRSEGRK